MDKQHKPIIFLKMEKDMPKKGWFSLVMGDSLYLDVSGDKFEDALDRVVEQVEKKLAAIKKDQEKAALTAAATKVESFTAGHSARLSGITEAEAIQKERTVFFEKWTKEEVALWVVEEDIK